MPQSVDHRTRVAIQRRERTRGRLLESALHVFAENGVNSSAIQQVIAVAKVSQGTFYNYFRTNEELLAAVSELLNNELLGLIEAEVGAYEDPARRIACGVRLYLHTARNYPLFGRFVCSAGLHAAGPSNLIYEFLPPHIEEGQVQGRFCAMPIEVALDLIAGAALTAVFRLTTGDAEFDYPEKVVAAILRGLGLTAAQAGKLATAELPQIAVSEDSLLVRANERCGTPKDET